MQSVGLPKRNSRCKVLITCFEELFRILYGKWKNVWLKNSNDLV